jgi:hypothetical protein
MAYKELVFDKEEFPDRLRGLDLLTDAPCKQVYGLVTEVPKHYMVMVGVQPMARALADVYGCDEVVGVDFSFMNDSDTTIDDKEREGVIRNILRTWKTKGMEEWRCMRKPIVLYNDRGVEQSLRAYGFQGPQRCTLGDRYVGSFGRFGDLFQISIDIFDAPEYGELYKHFYIKCEPITGNSKKKSRMIRHLLESTGIKNLVADVKNLI